MLRFACWSTFLLLFVVQPALAEEVETLPPLDVEVLPAPLVVTPVVDSPEIVTPSVIDEMPTLSAPSPHEIPISPTPDVVDAVKPPSLPLGGFWGYRTGESRLDWTVGDGDQFGSFWFRPDPYLPAGDESGLMVGLGVGFLAGPERTEMPPRVFDFSLGYQTRGDLGGFSYDLASRVQAVTDFEGSCRDGIRFPSHAVGYLSLNCFSDLVFGVDYLDRDDIRILPVFGLLLRPDPDVRIELVFPRPRLELQLTEENRLHLFGGLGGGTWAIERDEAWDDLASLYELELGIGLTDSCDDGDWSGMELVYLFDRRLEYASGVGDYQIGPTVMIRLVTRH